MDYKINLPVFEGPLDLLLHLVKQSNIEITDISIDTITKQYLEYINMMEEMNLNVASEYLVMASELIEIKSNSLLPVQHNETDEFEEDPRERLINRLLEYKYYKESTSSFKELESIRKEVYTKEPCDLRDYVDDNEDVDYGVDLNDLLCAFAKFLNEKETHKPLNTKITNKEYSVGKRSIEIRDIIRIKKKVSFRELFDVMTKEYIIVTFLAILSMSKKQEIKISQEDNFKDICIVAKDSD